MKRSDFQQLARLRVKEAKVLLDGGCYDGAYYLLGYAVECALKACIARQVARFDFPDKEFAQKVYTHNLGELMKHSGLQAVFDLELARNPVLKANWHLVKDWNESFRYQHGINSYRVQSLYAAVVSRGNGVLSWLKKRW